MKTATLTRNLKISGPEGTFGSWISGAGFKCVTLERPKLGEYPCISTGKYICQLRYSEKNKGQVYGLLNVPGRSDIEIHSANWFFQLLGCIAPGSTIGKMQTPDGHMIMGVSSSKATLKALMDDMSGEPFELIILEVM